MTSVAHPRWDPTERLDAGDLSASAYRALASLLHPGAVSDPFAVHFVDGSNATGLRRLAHGDLDVTTDDARQWLADSAFVAARTRFFDDSTMDACDDGVRQVVLLGSGLNARAHRLEWPHDAVIFDVDEPAIIAVKTATMERLGARAAVEYLPVGVDLTAGWGRLNNGWPVALERAGFTPSLPTAWVAESVLQRMSASGQQRLVRTVNAMSAPGSRFAADFLDVADLPRALADDAAGVRTWQRFDMLGDLVDLPQSGDGRTVYRVLRRLLWRSASVSSSDLLRFYGLPRYARPTAISNRIRFLAAAK